MKFLGLFLEFAGRMLRTFRGRIKQPAHVSLPAYPKAKDYKTGIAGANRTYVLGFSSHPRLAPLYEAFH